MYEHISIFGAFPPIAACAAALALGIPGFLVVHGRYDVSELHCAYV